MATIRERPGKLGITYLADVRLRRHRPVRKTFKRKTDAKRWATQTEAAIRERRYFRTAESEKHTLGDAITRYLEEVKPAPAQAGALRWWKKQLGERVLADVSSSIINEKKTELAKKTTRLKRLMNPATVNRYLAALSHMFTVCIAWEWIEYSPMGKKVPKFKEPPGRCRYLSDDERQALLKACRVSPERLLYPLVVLAISTGARVGELTALRWGDVDLEKGMGILHRTKNGERRALPIKGHALDVLRDLSKIRRIDTDLIFPREDGNGPWPHFEAWKVARESAKLENFRFHDLRHSAASELAMNGATLPEIAGVLGHKTLQMVKRYAHLSDQHISDAVEKMNQKMFAPRQGA